MTIYPAINVHHKVQYDIDLNSELKDTIIQYYVILILTLWPNTILRYICAINEHLIV